jgi:excisionase family DNA binding protein
MDSTTATQLGALLISDVEAAALCGCSRSHWRAMQAAGRIPASVKLGRKRLWRRREIESWILAGCPEGRIWAAMGSADRRLKTT